MRLSKAPVEDAEDQKLRERFIQLGGMQRHVERDAHQLVRNWILERHRPWQITLHSPTAASGKTAQPADPMAQSNPGSEYIRRFEGRQAMSPHVPPRDRQRREQSAIKYAARLERRQGEDLAWMLQIVRSVHHKHHQLGSHNGCQRAVDAQVSYGFGMELLAFRQARNQP